MNVVPNSCNIVDVCLVVLYSMLIEENYNKYLQNGDDDIYQKPRSQSSDQKQHLCGSRRLSGEFCQRKSAGQAETGLGWASRHRCSTSNTRSRATFDLLIFHNKKYIFLNHSVAVISCGNKTNFQTVQKNIYNCLNPDVAAACHSVEKHANVYLPDDRRARRDDSEALAPREFGSNLFFLFFFFSIRTYQHLPIRHKALLRAAL